MKKKVSDVPAPAAHGGDNRVWPYLVEAVLEALLAVILFVWKDDGAAILRIVLGAVLGVTGMVNILRYIAGRFTDFGLELLGGTVLLGLGLSFILHSEDYGTLFMLILILLIITDSLVDIRRSMVLKEHEFTFWYVLLFFSVAAVILSLLLYFVPAWFGDSILTVIGAILIYEAVSTVLTTISFSIIRRREARVAKKGPAKPEVRQTVEEIPETADPPVPEGFDDSRETVQP